MTLVIKDYYLQPAYISTQVGVAAGELAPVHVPAAMVAGVATPLSAAAPLPVAVSTGVVAVDGSGTIVSATVAQTIFGGVVPTTGFQIANNCASVIYVRDTGTAAAAAAGMPVPVGGTYTTPINYKPAGTVSLYGGTTSGNFEARRW